MIAVQTSGIESILLAEEQCHRDFFGREFDLSDFGKILKREGEENLKHWLELGLEPHFLPQIEISSASKFPGLKIKPNRWLQEQLLLGRIFTKRRSEIFLSDWDLFNLGGITVLIDTREKPSLKKDCRQMFDRDNLLGPLLKRIREESKIPFYKPPESRFYISSRDWEKTIKQTVIDFFRGIIVGRFWIRFERVIEALIIPQLFPKMPRGWEKEGKRKGIKIWLEEYYFNNGNRLCDNDIICPEVSGISHESSGNRRNDLAIRPLIILYL
jgi:hypothetical protein